MNKITPVKKLLWVVLICCLYTACHSGGEKKDVVREVTLLNGKISGHLQSDIANIKTRVFRGADDDSTRIANPEAVQHFYNTEKFSPVWSDTGRLFPQADSMLAAIANSDDNALDPEWYHYRALRYVLHQLKTDSVARYDAIKWAQADLLLTDAFIGMASQLHYGILPPDSISLQKDSVFSDSAVGQLLINALKHRHIITTLDSLRPGAPQYDLLSKALVRYKKENINRHWDTLPVDVKDSTLFHQLLIRRLLAGGQLDSSGLENRNGIKDAVKSFQRSHDLYPDGVAGKRTIEALNLSKAYLIKQIAVNMERWRHVGNGLPEEYIWVNIPSFTLTVWNQDTAVLRSKVIAGKPGHETPLLNSSITNFQLYPYWRVPMSIIANEMLPAIRRDTGYLRKHNLEIVDRHNYVVDASKLNWSKYNKHYFPYVIRQMTGLDNSLGIIKFNFKNKYSVYLHDTNLRNLFNLTHRDLSHGCIRVQQWDSLAMFLIRNDTLRHTRDSVQSWLQTQTQKWVSLKARVPVYIRYFTCEVNKQGKLIFYKDIYGYDSIMMRKIY